VSALWPEEIEAARGLAQAEDTLSLQSVLPSLEVVRRGVPKFLDAVRLHNGSKTVKALQEMGILRLCLPPLQQFDRLEFIVGCVVGRARLIPLVELAIFAAEQGAYARAKKCITEAHILGPDPPELHCLLTAAGMVALNSGEMGAAKECLLESVRVCQEDDFASVSCGVIGFSTILAEKLLNHGERQTVIAYLTACQIVWSHQRKEIDAWIRAIYAGENPEFYASRFLTAINSEGAKLVQLTLRASLLGDELTTQTPVGKDKIGREEGLKAFRSRNAAAARGKLDTSRN
jgi:hypothetical protein